MECDKSDGGGREGISEPPKEITHTKALKTERNS